MDDINHKRLIIKNKNMVNMSSKTWWQVEVQIQLIPQECPEEVIQRLKKGKSVAIVSRDQGQLEHLKIQIKMTSKTIKLQKD